MTATHQQPPPLPPAYWKLWFASTVSNLGDGVFFVALPLLAARLTRSEVSISLVGAAAALPWLLLSLPVGAIVDRVDRRILMIRADVFRAALVGGLAIIAATDVAEIWMLWLIALGLGIAEVFFDNASQAILPSIVEPRQLERANGRRYSAEVVANTFVGTPLGGVLFFVVIWLPFAFDAVSFLVAVVLVASLRGSFRPINPRSTSSTLSSDVRVGLRWLWDDRPLRGLAIALGMVNLAFQMSQAVFVLFAQDELHVSEGWYGLFLGGMGVGAVIGGLIGDRIVANVGPRFAIYSVLSAWAVALVGVAAVPVAWFVIVMVTMAALASTVWNVVTVSLRQQVVPDHLFGRVNAAYRWIGWGTMPIGALIGGQIAHRYGLHAPYYAGAAFVCLAAVVVNRHVTAGTFAEWSKPLAQPSDSTPVFIERDPWFDWPATP